MTLTRAVTSSRNSRLAAESNTEDKKPTKSEMRDRGRKLTKWGLRGGVGIGVEKDWSSYREDQEEKNNISKRHHRRLLRIKIKRDRATTTTCSCVRNVCEREENQVKISCYFKRRFYPFSVY